MLMRMYECTSFGTILGDSGLVGWYARRYLSSLEPLEHSLLQIKKDI